VQWLGRRQAITMIPSIASIAALRGLAKQSRAEKPIIGFGNPLLDGSGATDRVRAEEARAKQSCGSVSVKLAANAALPVRSIGPIPTQQGIAQVALIKAAPPLPETADEICAVARELHADVGDMRLGARATEREMKALSGSGQLASYRILHIATHGMLAGQLQGASEPGLILTPPQIASADDDGYLSASEIANLKLDADWVILSACNTAGGQGDARGAEALSGLARAFFYAGARAMLVSHWEVDSQSTVSLITGTVGAIANDSRLGRAEALRRAMVEMIDHGTQRQAHPAFWAPFVVVGEGAATRSE
jgi:CHAT domain-containing protein